MAVLPTPIASGPTPVSSIPLGHQYHAAHRAVFFLVDKSDSVQMLLEIIRTFGIAIAPAKFPTTEFLKVCWLGVDEHLVERWNAKSFDQPKIDAQSHFAQIMHGLFAADFLGRLKNSVSTAYQIAQIRSVFVQEKLSGVSLVIDQLRYDLAHSLDQLRLGLTKRCLIAYLIKIPHELGALTEETSHGDIDFAKGAKDSLDLLSGYQSWQMKHDTHTQPCTYVGRTSG